jgi:hypothetical protein
MGIKIDGIELNLTKISLCLIISGRAIKFGLQACNKKTVLKKSEPVPLVIIKEKKKQKLLYFLLL